MIFLKNRINTGNSSIKNTALSPQIARQISISQLDIRAGLAPRMAIAGSVVAAGLSWSFWDNEYAALLRGVFTALFASYLVLFGLARLWRQERQRGECLRRYQVYFCTITAVIGLLWSIVLIVGLHHSGPVQTNTLYALAVGLMSTPAFSGPAIYAFSLWVPVTIGAFLALIVDSATPPVPSLIGFGAYAFLTFTSIVSIDAATVDRELKRIAAQHQSEVIGLLLREFEAGSSDWLWETDADLRLRAPSTRFVQAACATTERIEAQSLFAFFHDHDPHEPDAATHLGALIDEIVARKPFNNMRIALDLGGDLRWWSLTGKPVFTDDGAFHGYRGVGSDVTEGHRAEQRIAFIASHDSLTGLANRHAFDKRLEDVCADPGPQGAALLCLDLDHFKAVNDSFGHGTGDELLSAVAKRILGCIRGIDRAYRLGGDEFAVVMPASGRIQAEAVAGRIIARLGTPFKFNGISVKVGVCIGIAPIDPAGREAHAVHHEADLALYRAKADGGATLRLFDPDHDRQIDLARELNFELENALPAQDFFLEYQPIVNLANGSTASVEALIRWNHPRHGILRPDQFIAVAENSGAVIPIGTRVIDMACAFAASLPETVSVAINLSPIQLHDAGLLNTIQCALERNALRVGRIEFELTETTLLDMSPHTTAVLRAIKALGCRIGLDDFGSGYSSVATLYYFPFDTMKIDRSLLRGAATDARRRAILGNVARLARDIGLVVTGEGAENENDVALLRDLGFDNVQGYYVAPPLNKVALQDWVRPVHSTLA